ncbi:isopenicillin N synthase family oxygenase [Gammaproteobacteria bacterium]|nr:isopenicillin N synthase family oxygenase [Gammaproteobacteria bacterium]
MTNLIPELSFREIEKGDSHSINLLKTALSDHGFFSITEHGLSKELVNNCYKSSKAFFDLDYEIKNIYSSVGSKGARGYTPKGIETAVGEKIADQKEFWHHGPVIDDSFDKKIPKNLNIEQVPQFNSNFDQLYDELHQIGSRVLSVIALSLGLDSNYFTSWIEKGNSLLRSIHYPPVESMSNPHRARAHEDINLITLLIGAEEGGLEVLNKDGSWIKVEPSSEAIVCNIGDMMQLVTDKKLKSTTHRVIQDPEAEPKSRYSIPFFLHPAPSINLKSIFRDDDEGILADTFLDQRLKEIKLY